MSEDTITCWSNFRDHFLCSILSKDFKQDHKRKAAKTTKCVRRRKFVDGWVSDKVKRGLIFWGLCVENGV